MLGTDLQDGVTDEINLKWLVPQDDGGFPITGKDVSVYKPPIVFVVILEINDGSEKSTDFFFFHYFIIYFFIQ